MKKHSGEKNRYTNVLRRSQRRATHGVGREEAKGGHVWKPIKIENATFQGHNALPASLVSEIGAWKSPGGNVRWAELGVG